MNILGLNFFLQPKFAFSAINEFKILLKID